MKFKILVAMGLLVSLSACVSKTKFNLNSNETSVRTFRLGEASQKAVDQLTPIGDIEHSVTNYSEEKASEEGLRYLQLEAKKMGAQTLVINKAETHYNVLSAKHTVVINATAYK